MLTQHFWENLLTQRFQEKSLTQRFWENLLTQRFWENLLTQRSFSISEKNDFDLKRKFISESIEEKCRLVKMLSQRFFP
jgi:hypothetical protein